MIWVDAVCTNQTYRVEEVTEKASQIALMVDIYPQARRVYIWLDSSGSSLDPALQFLATHTKSKSCVFHPSSCEPGLSTDSSKSKGGEWQILFKDCMFAAL
jgi:Heterokaryon incompatibility protein (HET)